MTSLAKLLEANKDVLSLLPNNKIKCSVTGHEMSCDAIVVQAHLAGKKFKKAKRNESQDLGRFAPLIIQNVENEDKMYCTLTGFTLNKIASEIETHMKGKRFKRLRKEYDEMEARKQKKKDDREERLREREEMEKAGIWVPDDNLALSDDEVGEEDDAEPRGSTGAEADAMDQDVDDDLASDVGESDEDWIITSPKLERMRMNGVAESVDDEALPTVERGSTSTSTSSNTSLKERRRKKKQEQVGRMGGGKKRGQDEASTKKKRKQALPDNKKKVRSA